MLPIHCLVWLPYQLSIQLTILIRYIGHSVLEVFIGKFYISLAIIIHIQNLLQLRQSYTLIDIVIIIISCLSFFDLIEKVLKNKHLFISY